LEKCPQNRELCCPFSSAVCAVTPRPCTLLLSAMHSYQWLQDKGYRFIEGEGLKKPP